MTHDNSLSVIAMPATLRLYRPTNNPSRGRSRRIWIPYALSVSKGNASLMQAYDNPTQARIRRKSFPA